LNSAKDKNVSHHSSPLHAKRNTTLTVLIDSRIYQKMSGSMFNEIPKLASSRDYLRWAQTVSAYLGVQKALKVITKTPTVLVKTTTRDNQDELDT
jgi:hypothetical protein